MNTKAKILGISCAAMMIFAVGCGEQTSTPKSDGDTSFKAIITQMQGEDIIVEPYKDQTESSKEKILVSTDISKENLPGYLAPGKTVIITYDGNITDGNPAQIDGTLEINLVGIKGEIIENK